MVATQKIKPPKSFFQHLASLPGWDIAKTANAAYDGDSDPINHGGFFYDPKTWNEGHARTVEFWHDDEHNTLVVQKGTLYRPTTQERWQAVWNGAPHHLDRTNIHAQISYTRDYTGIEPEGTHYPSLKDFDPNTWHEWRIWRSIYPWIEALGN